MESRIGMNYFLFCLPQKGLHSRKIFSVISRSFKVKQRKIWTWFHHKFHSFNDITRTESQIWMKIFFSCSSPKGKILEKKIQKFKVIQGQINSRSISLIQWYNKNGKSDLDEFFSFCSSPKGKILEKKFQKFKVIQGQINSRSISLIQWYNKNGKSDLDEFFFVLFVSERENFGKNIQ